MKLIGWFRLVVGVAIAVGALAYTTVNAPGYYAESGDGAMVILFAVLTVVTVIVAVALARGEVRDEAVGAARVPGRSSGEAGPG